MLAVHPKTIEIWNPEVATVNIFGAARLATAGLNLNFFAAHQRTVFSRAATASWRRANDLGNTIKYQRKKQAAPRPSA
jgi:hypothetical protein